jgi:hypothetical protein
MPKNNKIIVFVRNKLITLDTVLPVLLEMKDKHNISSEIIVFDKLAHDAIYKNVVLRDAINYIGREVFITKGIKLKLLRRMYVLLVLSRLTIDCFRGNKIIHFGHLNKWPLKFLALLFNKNTYQMQGSAYGFKYSQINRSMKNLVLPPPVGKNIIICAKNIEQTGFNNSGLEKNIYSFGETRTRKSWVGYINSKSDYYFSKYHPDIDPATGPIVFILGAIDGYERQYKLFHLTIKVLSSLPENIPILLKPHAYTEMDTVYKAIAGLDSFHITYLHPSVLATRARVFLSNSFSNTLADAHSYGVKTVEYSHYASEKLEITNYGSSDPQFVDYFINNDNNEFINIMNEILGHEYNRSLFRGHNIDDNGLFKSFLS